MSNGDDSVNLAELEAAINFFYDKFKSQETNHFELLGLSHTATHRDIEAAYLKYSQEFSPEKIAKITNIEVKEKGDFLFNRGRLAYDTLINFDKRAEYEKRGFKDEEPEKEEDDEEKARAIYKKAKSLKTMKEYRKAALVMTEAIKLDPNKPSYYLLIGLCQSQVPELRREAENNLQKAAELESWNAEPLVGMGMLFFSERLFKRAEMYFRKALELEPKHEIARAKLEEIVGPEVKAMDKVKKNLSKVFPTIFGKKK
jgi:tetratricopeptide (TPR) repeat protein